MENLMNFKGFDLNINRPIVETLADVGLKYGYLSDYDFDLILAEYEADEDKVFTEMLHCKTHQFVRHPDGWNVHEVK